VEAHKRTLARLRGIEEAIARGEGTGEFTETQLNLKDQANLGNNADLWSKDQ